MPLGLISSEQIDDYWSQNTRRKVFYSYPNGTAPLTGFLSLGDSEDTPQPQFGWNEERWTQIRTTTTANDANTAFYLGGTTTTAGTTFTPTAGTAYRIYVTDASLFQIDDNISVTGLTVHSSGVKTETTFRITGTNTAGTDYLEVVCNFTAPGAVRNSNATPYATSLPVVHMGSSYAEGSRSRTGHYTFPSEILNFTTIDKTPFEMTRTALKEPLKYDKSGAYKDQLKKNGIKHMAGMEWKAFFSNRRSTTAIDDDTGATVSRRDTGGLLWFLKQWEKGSVSAGGAFDYGQSDVSAETDYITYTNKRIIRLAGAAISRSTFEEIEGRFFERTNATEWCKLCLCGQGYLNKIASAYERNVQKSELRGETYKGWNFEMVERSGNAGKVYYKVHPLFNNTDMRNSAFYIDLGYIQYRPLSDSDTDVQPMIQANDADKRKDQYLTEWGLELAYPEAHGYVENLGGITAG